MAYFEAYPLLVNIIVSADANRILILAKQAMGGNESKIKTKMT